MNLSTVRLRDKMTDEDFNTYMSLGIVVKAPLGTLIALRAELVGLLTATPLYTSLSKDAFYVVHWDELSEAKQQQLSMKYHLTPPLKPPRESMVEML